MAVCPSCGRENADDARFCSACGTALVVPEPAREQRKVVTVLFCDLVGSTALGESTDPEALRSRMRLYFDDLRAIVERHGGVVEKFVGDAVMAVFGIPVSHEDDALRAVRAAWEMRDAVSAHGLEARIGVNTGEVVTGGEGETLVTGDAVNVAARLEQAAPAGAALLGGETLRLVRDAVRVEPVEPLVFKGKSAPVETYRLVELLPDAEGLARQPHAPPVGRERERERLRRDFEDVVAKRTCRLFTLLGPAGIGKSRLVADFLDRSESEAGVLRGRCLPYGEGITYWPLVEMLVQLGVEPESVVGSSPEETRVALRKLLESRARERPQIVVIDDLQWAEPVFLDLVEHVADFSRDSPIMLLCIARTELLERRSGWGGGKLNATSVLLEPLDEDERAALIENLMGGDLLETSTRERIVGASEGNPLYVEEMIAMVRDRRDEREVAVPPTIQALLQARLDTLQGEERLVLERAAVEGQVFHRGSVAALAPEGLRSTLDAHLAALVRKELIRPEDALFQGEEAFRFRHILIRDAAYTAVPKKLRAELHESFAEWLERSASGAAAFELDEILGYHFEQAHRFCLELGLVDDAEHELAGRASARLLAAGAGALGRADLPAAVGLLQRGIDLLRDDDPRRLEALPDLAQALVRRGELERADEILRSAIEEAHGRGHGRIEARIRLGFNSIQTMMDPEATVERELREALEIASSLEQSGDLSTLALAYVEIGMCRFMLGHAGEGETDLERAAELARQVGDGALERTALNSRLRPITYGPTPAEDGIAFCTMLVESEIANVADKAHALQVRSLFLAMQADFVGARNSSSRASALIEEFGLTRHKGIYATDVGFAELLAGDLSQSERELRDGHDLLVEIGDTGVRSTVDAMLADVLFRQGRYDEATHFAEESRAISAADDLDAQPRWRTALARVLLRQGDHAEAERLVREAAALLEPLDFIGLQADVLTVLGEVLASSGRVDEAVTAVERALALYERKGNVISAAQSRSTLDELRAARAWTSGS